MKVITEVPKEYILVSDITEYHLVIAVGDDSKNFPTLCLLLNDGKIYSDKTYSWNTYDHKVLDSTCFKSIELAIKYMQEMHPNYSIEAY